MSDLLGIKILGSLDSTQTVSEINKQLRQLEKDFKISFGTDTSALKTLQDKVKQLQKQIQDQSKGIKLIDDDAILKGMDKLQQEGQQLFSTINKAKEAYSALGQVKVTSNFNNLTNQIDGFTLAVKKSEAEVEKLQFKIAGYTSAANGALKPLYTNTSSTITDNSQAVNEKIIQQENSINEALKEREKQQESVNQQIQKQLELYQQEKQIQAQTLSVKPNVNTDSIDSQLSKVMNPEQSFSSVKDFQTWQKEMNLGFQQISAEATTSSKSVKTLGDSFKNAFSTFGAYTTASYALFASFGLLKEGIDYVNQLNKSLTEIAIVTGKSQDQVAQLGKQYAQLASSMGVTTEDITGMAAALYRQGLSQSQVMERMKQITEYAKVSSLDMNTAEEIITATTNSMGVSAKKASDTFSYLGDATATGADEIGKAFQKVGGSASALNLNFDKVSSWIATISSKTRESADTIGESIKSILARVQSLKEKGFTEDGMGVNQVGKALDAVGIKLLDSNGQFRNFGTVMDEIGKKWKDLDNRQQAYLATTIAGSYQQSRFLNLMNNYSQSVNLYQNSLNSAGTTQQKYNIYLDSTEAHLNKLKDAFTSTFTSAINSNAIRSMVDGLTGLITIIGKVINTFGIIPTTLGVATAGLLTFSKTARDFATLFTILPTQIKATGSVIQGLSAASSTAGIQMTGTISILTKMSTFFKTLPISIAETGISLKALSVAAETAGISFKAVGLSIASFAAPIAIIMGLGAAISYVTNKISDQKAISAEAQKQMQTEAESFSSNSDKIKSLASEYENLSNVRSKGKLNNDQEQQYVNIQNQLARLLPSVAAGTDAKGNSIIKSTGAVKDQIKAMEQLISLEQEKQKLDAPNAIQSNSSKLDATGTGLIANYDEYKKTADMYQKMADDAEHEGKSREDILKNQQLAVEWGIKANTVQTQMNANLQDTAKNAKTILSDTKLNPQLQTDVANLVSELSFKGKDSGQIQAIITQIGNAVAKLQSAMATGTKTDVSQAKTNLQGLLDAYGKGKVSVSDFSNVIKEASNSTDTNTKSTQANKTAVDSSSAAYDTYKKSVDAANKSITDLTTSAEVIAGVSQKEIDHIKDLANTYSLLSSSQSLTADQQKLLKDTTAELSNLYPQFANNHQVLIGSIQTEAEQQDILLQAINKVTSGQADSQTKQTTAQVLGARARLETMSKELDALQQMEQAYQQATSSAVYQAEQYGKAGDEAQSQDAYIRAQKMQGMQQQTADNYKTQKKSIDDLIPSVDSLTKKLADETGYQGQIYSSTTKSNTATQNATSVTDKYSASLDKVNEAIQQQENLQNTLSQRSADYQQSLSNENDLLQKKLSLLQQEAQALQNQINNPGYTTTTTTSSPSSSGGGAVTGRYSTQINSAAMNYGIDPALVKAVATQESGLGSSSSNVMQVNGMNGAGATASINKGTQMLSDLLKKTNGDIVMALAAYNMGEGVLSWFKSHGGYSVANMQSFSDYEKQKNGYSKYGDPNYVNHVLQYYPGSSVSSSGKVTTSKTKNDTTQAQSDLINVLSEIDSVKGQIQDNVLKAVNGHLANYQYHINATQNSIDSSTAKSATMDTASSSYSKELSYQIHLYEQKEKYEKNSINYINEQIKSNKKLTSAQKDDLQSQADALKKQIDQDKASVNGLALDKVNGQIQAYTNKVNSLDTAIANSQNKLNSYSDKSSSAYQKEAQNQINLLNQKKKIDEQTVSYINNQIKHNGDLTAKQKADLKTQVASVQAAINDINQSISSIDYDKLQGSLQGYQDKIDGLNQSLAISQEHQKQLQEGSKAWFDEAAKQASYYLSTLKDQQAEIAKINADLKDKNLTPANKSDLEKQLKDLQLQAEQTKSALVALKQSEVDALSNTLSNQKQANIDHLNQQFSTLDDTLSKLVKTTKSFDMNSFNTSIADALNTLNELDGSFANNPLFESTGDVRNNIAATASKINSLNSAVQSFVNSTSKSQDGMEKIIRSESDYANQINGQISAMDDQIQSTTLLYKQQEDAMQNQIDLKQTQLDQLDQQYQMQQRIQALTDLQNQLSQAEADKRFEKIGADGSVNLTYDVAKVTDLQNQLDQMNQQNAQDDAKQALQDQIDAMTKNLDQQKQIHQADLQQMQLYRDSLQNLYDQLNTDIGTKMDALKQMQQDQIDTTSKNWDDLITAVTNGTMSYSKLMTTWYKSTIDDMKSYNSDVAGQIAALKQQFADLTASEQALNAATGANNPTNSNPKDYKVVITDPKTKKSTTKTVKTKADADKIVAANKGKQVTVTPEYHEGGIVGSTPATNNRLTQLANQLFNVKPGEQIVKSLIGELQVPPKNIPNLFTNITNMVNKLVPNMPVVQTGNTIHLHNVTVNTENGKTFLPDLQRAIKMRTT